MTDTERFTTAIHAYCKDQISSDELHAVAVDTGHTGLDVLAAIDKVTAEGLRSHERRHRLIMSMFAVVIVVLLVLSVVTS